MMITITIMILFNNNKTKNNDIYIYCIYTICDEIPPDYPAKLAISK